MSATYDDRNRQAIPRCLQYATACSLRILRINRKQEQVHKNQVKDSDARMEWIENPRIATAVDLVAEALIIKDFESDEAIKAAHHILKKAPASSRLIRELANHFLEPPSLGEPELGPITQTEVVYEHIARIKKSVRLYHMNPIAWSDMALSYALLGQKEKARKAMEVALSLGRTNRFILRSAARCFLHLEEPDRAVTILNRSGLCPFDPWIASAEIAISASKGLKSKCISKAKHLVLDENLTPFSRSELTVGMGTMEIKNGSVRRAKKLMRQALRDPTENALAQAEWMAYILKTDITDIAQSRDRVPASYEAEALHLFYNKQFADSIKAAEKWGRFQPLSSRPIILSSYLASVCLNDDTEALRILKSSLSAQRKDPVLLNNYACCLARSGNIDDAIQELHKAKLFRDLEDWQKLTLVATQGLIYFRTDKTEQGRESYSLAIREFERINDKRSAAIAAYYLAFEEKRIQSPYASERVKDAKSRIERFNVFELEELAKKL